MKAHRILLLDDDSQGGQIRVVVLERSGYETHRVSSIAQASRALESDPDISALIIVSDLLREMSMHFCAGLKQHSTIPILCLGQSVIPSRNSLRYCDDYVQSLEGPAVWLESLRRLIEHHEVRRRHSMRNILNVDDNLFQRYATSRMLRNDGYRVMEAESGKETLELAMRHPDLILLDINLPDLDGFEVCRRLRANPVTAAIPIMHLSATSTSSESRARGLANGADEYLNQPIARERLLGAIATLIDRAAN